MFETSEKLPRRTREIGIVGFVAPGKRHMRGMVQIFVPHAIQPVAARLGPHKARVLRFVLGDDQNAAPAGRCARLGGQLGDDIARRVVEDLLGGVEAQPVEMKFTHQ